MKTPTFFILFLFTIGLTSCIVTKKKYEAMQAQKNKTIDSLSTILGDTRQEFEQMHYNMAKNNAKKMSQLDSLSIAVQKLASDTSALGSELRKAIASYNDEKTNLTNARTQLEDKQRAVEKLTQELEEKKKRLETLEEMINKNKEETEKLKNTVSKALLAFKDNGLKVYQKDGKVYVSLDEKLLFKSGSSKVDSKGQEALKKLAKVLEENTNTEIMIEGHTDDVGSAEYNWDLSVKRATSIIKILQDNSSIEPKRFIAAGRGMYLPIDETDTDQARQKNRRTEIILIPKLDQLYEILDEDLKK